MKQIINRRKTINSVTAMVMLVSTSSYATPTIFPRPGNRLVELVNKTSSTVLADHQDMNTVYVKPPSSGTAIPQGFSAMSANLGFCREMEDLQGYSRNLSGRIAAKSDEVDKLQVTVADAQEKLNKARGDLASLSEASSVFKEITALETRITDIEARTDALYTKLAGCTNECADVKKEITELRVEHRNLTKRLSEIRVANSEEIKRRNKALAAIEAAQLALDEATAPYDRAISALSKARNSILDSYSHFAKLSGGTATIQYESGWIANTQKIRAENAASFNVQQIPTSKVQMHFNFLAGAANADAYLASLPPILSYSVGGIGYTPGGGPETNSLPAFPDSLSANLALSLVGACPLVNPKRFDIPKNAAGIPAFGVTVQYLYPAMMQVKAKFTYNLYKFYELMRSSGSSGGLFSTHSWSSVSEKMVNKDHFYIDWKNEDADNQITPEKRQQIETMVKAELTQRVLNMMGTPVANSGQALLGAPPIPVNGALVIADGLNQTCGFYSYYCVAGSWILRAASAIWGSSSSSQTFQQVHDITATEDWSRDEAVNKPEITIFSKTTL